MMTDPTIPAMSPSAEERARAVWVHDGPSVPDQIQAAFRDGVLAERAQNETVQKAMSRFHAKDREVAVKAERARLLAALREPLRKGRQIKPETCERCGNRPTPRQDGKSGLHGHHTDYAQPLSVIWLCQGCHAAEHRSLADKEPSP